jgi:hypothetical protein
MVLYTELYSQHFCAMVVANVCTSLNFVLFVYEFKFCCPLLTPWRATFSRVYAAGDMFVGHFGDLQYPHGEA